MQYLNPPEYVSFGLGDDTADDLVTAASALIDSFCRRPSLGITEYVERLRLARRDTVQLSNTPLVSPDGVASALVLVRARTGANAVWHCVAWPIAEDACALVPQGSWVNIDASTIDIAPDGMHVFGGRYSEVDVTYTAGYATVPTAIKVACAQIVRNAQAMPALNVRRQSMDSMQMEYFSSTLLDADVQRLLSPYQSQRMG